MRLNLFGMGSTDRAPSFDADGGTSGGGAAGGAPGADGGAAGGQPGGSGADGGGGKPPEGGAAPETFTLKVNGEDKTYTRAEYDELASKGGNYTQDKQALAEERKAWERDRDSLIRSETDRRIEEMRAEDRHRAEADDGLSDGDKLGNRMTLIEETQQDEALEGKIAQFQKEYGKDFNRSIFIDMATQAGIQDLNQLDALAKEHVEGSKASNLDFVKSVLEDENHPLTKEFSKKITDAWVTKKLNADPAGGGGSTGPTEILKGKDGKPLTDDEIDAASVAELTGSGL